MLVRDHRLQAWRGCPRKSPGQRATALLRGGRVCRPAQILAHVQVQIHCPDRGAAARPGTAACPALLSKAQAVAKGDFDDYVERDPQPMSVADQLELADILEIWMD